MDSDHRAHATYRLLEAIRDRPYRFQQAESDSDESSSDLLSPTNNRNQMILASLRRSGAKNRLLEDYQDETRISNDPSKIPQYENGVRYMDSFSSAYRDLTEQCRSEYVRPSSMPRRPKRKFIYAPFVRDSERLSTLQETHLKSSEFFASRLDTPHVPIPIQTAKSNEPNINTNSLNFECLLAIKTATASVE
jgi:hypothetical protein